MGRETFQTIILVFILVPALVAIANFGVYIRGLSASDAQMESEGINGVWRGLSKIIFSLPLYVALRWYHLIKLETRASWLLRCQVIHTVGVQLSLFMIPEVGDMVFLSLTEAILRPLACYVANGLPLWLVLSVSAPMALVNILKMSLQDAAVRPLCTSLLWLLSRLLLTWYFLLPYLQLASSGRWFVCVRICFFFLLGGWFCLRLGVPCVDTSLYSRLKIYPPTAQSNFAHLFLHSCTSAVCVPSMECIDCNSSCTPSLINLRTPSKMQRKHGWTQKTPCSMQRKRRLLEKNLFVMCFTKYG